MYFEIGGVISIWKVKWQSLEVSMSLLQRHTPILPFSSKIMRFGAREVACGWVKVLAARLNNGSSILGAHMVK